MTIAEEVSKIMGIKIEPNKWEQAINYIDRAGMFTRKKQMEIMIVMLRRLEEMENGK